MSQSNSRSHVAARRAELMSELLLQDLNPDFISRPTTEDVGYDLLAGFTNEKGGINTFAIEIKPTERSPGKRFQFLRRTFNRFAHSNIPGLLLVADVKHNQMYYAWLTPKNFVGGGHSVLVPLTELDAAAKRELKNQFEAVDRGVAVAG